jgi:prophage antirepressor-like protein
MELMNYTFEDKNIRIVDIKGEPWFVAADVCRVLGMFVQRNGAPNVTMALNKVAPEETGFIQIETNSRGSGVRMQSVKAVNESGLYKLIMRSDKPQARAFQDWVTRDVLPAIRKDGGYIMGEEKVATGELSEDQFILQAMTMLKSKADRLQKKVSDHLEYMTVDEFFALKHIYPAKGDNQSLGRRASMICASRDIPKRKQRRYAPAIEMMVEVGEYPVAVLEEAFDGMVKIGRIPAELPQMELGLA